MDMPDFSRKEEQVHYLTHGVAAIISFYGLAVLIQYATPFQDTLLLISYIIFGLSLIAVFLASTIYHWVDTMPLKRHLRVLDHLAIYLVVAGTYAPFMLVNLREHGGIPIIGIIWTSTALGMIFKILIRNNLQKYEKIDATIYAVLGSAAFFFMDKITTYIDGPGVQLLCLGGAAYLVGIYFYLGKHIPYHHAIWHLFVIAGAGCHFFAVIYYAVP